MFTDFVNDCKATRLALGLGSRANIKTSMDHSLKVPLKSAPEVTVSA